MVDGSMDTAFGGSGRGGAYRACCAVALVWLLGSTVVGLKVWPVGRDHDFSQFYMGGVIARLGAWGDLYPAPRPGSADNPGESGDSTMRPIYAAEAARRGVGDHQRYIQPPPFALLLAPLGALPYEMAKKAWNLAMLLCAWGIAVAAGRVYRRCAAGGGGEASRGAGLVVLLVAGSPLTFDTLRMMNVSPAVGAVIGLATLGLLGGGRRWPIAGGLSAGLGVVMKYATLALLPMYVATRRWRAIGWGVAAAAAWVAASVAVMGTGPFTTFAREIAPTLSRVHTMEWNQSAFAVAGRASGAKAPAAASAAVKGGVRAAQVTLALVIAGLMLRRRGRWTAAQASAGAAALVGWVLIFSPVYWDHYLVYLCPFWGWLVWEGTRSRGGALIAAVVIGKSWVPDVLADRFKWLQGPHDSATLGVTVLVVVLALWRMGACGPEGRVREADRAEREEMEAVAAG